ncbi:LL-diaminopimelate aminotransferase [Dissulfurirhabdus thermomarina]|uniref:LL-diaminopimelate aminotransferase n=1 Tax=Dissulfurirhabdus thermomarina TaxID=1765737 RepID=A0A6N9TNM8_DISTH|nr:LL-diaminopimelate aminotransferase [Dissulfurirhabdus thermomarina]NDY42759.1 LL-diaminopimelate aminotransferase [Dissulfurirhabdus thermomarina]NMX22599.1 LL-diaminopimelate aminotransferase [Dissulfurirhabdus thermomarina]
MDIRPSARLAQLPPYLFVELDRLKAEAVARGVDVIDLGIGDPDLPTPRFIVERLAAAAADPATHRYPSSAGSAAFRAAAAAWMERRFGVRLDPEREVTALIGSKEGIAHFPLAFLDPGEVVLVPTPGYPVYHIGTLFAGGETYELPLVAGNAFLPDLDAVPADVRRRARILWLNYPNNPTGAVAPPEFFERVVAFARANDIIVCHDAAYTEMTYDGYRAPSFLETPGAREVGIEFHSLSKTYNMTGWRIGFAAGHPDLVAGLRAVKSNVDSGQFDAVQAAAVAALESDQSSVRDNAAVYAERRDTLVEGLRRIGIEAPLPKATFYVWARVPGEETSAGFARRLLEEAGVVATPGNGFGAPGEGYVRMALTVARERLAEAVERIRKIL